MPWRVAGAVVISKIHFREGLLHSRSSRERGIIQLLPRERDER
jgi:hypothetical protein